MLQAVRLLTELARPSDHRRESEDTMVEPGQSTSTDTSIQFREIYKNGWLRRTDKTDKETSRFWVSFCVHDDIEPKLEGFIDQKHATTHSPLWSNSLRGIQHVTPTLCATSRHDYEYCINFNDDRVLRLAAPTYQGMLDWVQLITRKLTDMKILRPKENLYSRGPERIATRDPTSPLPPPPSLISSSENIALQNSTIDTSPPPPTPTLASASASASVPPPLISTPNLTNSPARVESPQTTSMIFTFEDISIEERRTRSVQSQIQRTSPPTPSPRSIPTTSTDESSYESIFMASSYAPSSIDEPIRNIPRETITSSSSSSSPPPPQLTSQPTPPPPSLQSQPQPQPTPTSSSSSSSTSSSSSSSSSLSVVPSQSEPSNERYAVLMEYRSSTSSEPLPRSLTSHTPETTESINRPSVSNLSRILTLREQQICQLKREMNHRAGVRLKLGRRDCKDSIAFVDTFGSIWVAGWKQREHPQLYNVLHVGDMVLSVAGQVPSNANGIKDILKGITTPRVEVIVRRLPYARAMTLRKRTDSDDFGLEVNGNEISGVTGVALSAGLPQLADATNPSAPSGSNTTWTLTEVNGKPLSIFDGGANDRLGAVGRDISIVIQPTDLVWSFRKKLRTMRNYKNFILQ